MDRLIDWFTAYGRSAQKSMSAKNIVRQDIINVYENCNYN